MRSPSRERPEAAELEQCAAEQEAPLAACLKCRPRDKIAIDSGPATPLTRLARDVLDYVLDVALIHMEHAHPPYRLCVADVAACCGKTPAQLADALGQLVRQGLVASEAKTETGASLDPGAMLFPTSAALRTLDAFRDQSDANLQLELDKLLLDNS